MKEEKLIDLRNMVYDARRLQEELETAECMEIDEIISSLEILNNEIYEIIENIEI